MSTTLYLPAKISASASDIVRHPVLLIGLHWLGLAYLQFPFWGFIGPFILLATYFSTERVRLISTLNLVFVGVSGSVLSVSTPITGDLNYVWPPPWVEKLEVSGWIVTAGIYAGFILVYYLLFSVLARFKSIRFPVTVSLAVVGAIACATQWLAPGTLVRAIAIGLTFALTRAFWAMSYQLSETDFLRRIPFMVHLGTLSSPWQSGWASNCIVRGHSDYSNFAAQDREQFLATQLSALRLIFSAVVFQIIAEIFRNYFFGPAGFSLATGQDFSTSGYLNQTLPRSYAWLFVYCQVFYFLLTLTAFTHAAVSIARMCGFNVWRNVYRPLEATSFNNFLSRIYFYYIAVIQRFFFYPIWRALRWISKRRLRAALTVLGAIFLGGMVTTTLRYLPFQIEDLSELVTVLKIRTAYFSLLGILCAVSALAPSLPAVWERPFPRVLRGLWYCALYGLCYSTQLTAPEFGAFQGFYNLSFLFGF